MWTLKWIQRKLSRRLCHVDELVAQVRIRSILQQHFNNLDVFVDDSNVKWRPSELMSLVNVEIFGFQ